MSGRKTVRRPAGDNLQHPVILKLRKGGHDIPPPSIDEEIAAGDESLQVHPRKLLQPRVVARPLQLVARQLDRALDVADVTVLQQRVAQHGAKRRSQRGGELEGDALVRHPPQHLEQRQVGLCDRLVQPILLQKLLILQGAARKEGAHAARALDSRSTYQKWFPLKAAG